MQTVELRCPLTKARAHNREWRSSSPHTTEVYDSNIIMASWGLLILWLVNEPPTLAPPHVMRWRLEQRKSREKEVRATPHFQRGRAPSLEIALRYLILIPYLLCMYNAP